jgi:hypothetical protein
LIGVGLVAKLNENANRFLGDHSAATQFEHDASLDGAVLGATLIFHFLLKLVVDFPRTDHVLAEATDKRQHPHHTT